jgi:transposase InsO family protein
MNDHPTYRNPQKRGIIPPDWQRWRRYGLRWVVGNQEPDDFSTSTETGSDMNAIPNYERSTDRSGRPVVLVPLETMEVLYNRFCIETVGRLLERQTCEIFNTDQGAQFTTSRFTQPLLARGVLVSMDGRGRAFDTIFIERLWPTVKYDYVYLHDIQTVSDLRVGFGDFFD